MKKLALAVSLLILFFTLTYASDGNRALDRYLPENLGSDFQVVQVDHVSDFVRSLQTEEGERSVHVLQGSRVLITYKTSEGFVNMKVEQLGQTYLNDKQVLINSMLWAERNTAGMDSTEVHRFSFNGFDTRAINRAQLEGGVLSIYALFDDAHRIVITLYFLNDDPSNRKFSTVTEYDKIRDEFLNLYTFEVRAKLTEK